MKRFKYNNAIHKIALSAIVASFAGVVACDDVYWDREAYDGFIDTFGVKHPSQFDLNNNVCAYIARESMGIEKLNGSNWQNAIAEYHTQHPNDPIAPECLAQGDSTLQHRPPMKTAIQPIRNLATAPKTSLCIKTPTSSNASELRSKSFKADAMPFR